VISIVDYGVGNIQAIANIYKRLNIPVRIAGTAEELAGAERMILPGVGAFDWAMARLNNSGMRAGLDDLVLSKGRPVLGICVGMQMMAKRSDEGTLEGLGWIDGEVKKFEWAAPSQRAYLPHMGWNDVEPRCR
jgi:glutamine amidotransferase